MAKRYRKGAWVCATRYGGTIAGRVIRVCNAGHVLTVELTDDSIRSIPAIDCRPATLKDIGHSIKHLESVQAQKN